jgi:hypothetical protein
MKAIASPKPAAGHVHMLGLGVYDSFLSSEQKPDGQQRSVAYHMPQLPDAR